MAASPEPAPGSRASAPGDDAPPATRQARRAIVQEVGLVFALSLGGCLACIGLGRLVPFVQHNLHAFVALVFLLLPSWALGRRGEVLEDRGLNGVGLGRALLAAGLFALVTFPPYAVGHHEYQSRVFQRTLAFDWTSYSAFPEECQGAPGSRGSSLAPPGAPPPVLTVWCERDEVQLRWRGELSVEARGTVTAGPRSQGLRVETGQGGLTLSGADGVASLRVPPQAALRLWPHRGDEPLAPAAVEVGPRGRRAEELPLPLGRGLWWLLELLLAQLIAVALPEEVFYRGYVQGRLAEAFPRRRRLLGASVPVGAVLLTSVLFALGHFLLDLNPQRLAVFFPSLLFGWLRCYTPTLAGSVAYHALCNVLVRVLFVHY